jgi:hypothetical protein
LKEIEENIQVFKSEVSKVIDLEKTNQKFKDTHTQIQKSQEIYEEKIKNNREDKKNRTFNIKLNYLFIFTAYILFYNILILLNSNVK